MTKIIKIESCYDCPKNIDDICIEYEPEINIEDETKIPSWCPLCEMEGVM